MTYFAHLHYLLTLRTLLSQIRGTVLSHNYIFVGGYPSPRPNKLYFVFCRNHTHAFSSPTRTRFSRNQKQTLTGTRRERKRNKRPTFPVPAISRNFWCYGAIFALKRSRDSLNSADMRVAVAFGVLGCEGCADHPPFLPTLMRGTMCLDFLYPIGAPHT